jgi:hypothetical protein
MGCLIKASTKFSSPTTFGEGYMLEGSALLAVQPSLEDPQSHPAASTTVSSWRNYKILAGSLAACKWGLIAALGMFMLLGGPGVALSYTSDHQPAGGHGVTVQLHSAMSMLQVREAQTATTHSMAPKAVTKGHTELQTFGEQTTFTIYSSPIDVQYAKAHFGNDSKLLPNEIIERYASGKVDMGLVSSNFDLVKFVDNVEISVPQYAHPQSRALTLTRRELEISVPEHVIRRIKYAQHTAPPAPLMQRKSHKTRRQ